MGSLFTGFFYALIIIGTIPEQKYTNLVYPNIFMRLDTEFPEWMFQNI